MKQNLRHLSPANTNSHNTTSHQITQTCKKKKQLQKHPRKNKRNLSVWHTKIQTLRDERVRSDRGVDQNDLELKQECFRTEMAEKETKRVERERREKILTCEGKTKEKKKREKGCEIPKFHYLTTQA